MKLSRHILPIFAFCSVGLFAGMGSAQELKPAPKPNTGNVVMPDRATLLASTLKLNDAQKAKLKVILDEEITEQRSLRANTNLTQQVRMAKIKEIRDGTTAKLKPVLNDEQFEKWQKMRNPNRSGQRPGGPGVPGPGPTAPAAPTAPAVK
jgi:hypothetical protein